MGEQSICNQCHKGYYVNEKCNFCGAVKKKNNTANALPNGHCLHGGRYRILRCIGGGGYGITYETLDMKNGCTVALKEFFPMYLVKRAPDRINVVCKEAEKQAELDHSKFRFVEEMRLLLSLNGVKEIVKVYSGFEENNTAYYTMELLSGMDMQRYMTSHGIFTWQALSPILIQMLRALHVLHQSEYIHRDVTPDNIFLMPNQEAKLIDFGNARRFTAKELTAVVKPTFAPIEQYSRTEKQGPGTDIYSLCVTIHYALTGKLPVQAKDGSVDTSLLQSMEQIPVRVRKAVQIGTASKINQRFQSIADFAYYLYPEQMVLKGAQNPNNNGKNTQMETRKKVVPGLRCIQGVMCGKSIALQMRKVYGIGRSEGKSIQYPDSAKGISRNQCSIWWDPAKSLFIRDDNSSYGTFVNGQRLMGGQWYQVKDKDIVTFGKEIYIISYGMK